jgi:hypothetical protein
MNDDIPLRIEITFGFGDPFLVDVDTSRHGQVGFFFDVSALKTLRIHIDELLDSLKTESER